MNGKNGAVGGTSERLGGISKSKARRIRKQLLKKAIAMEASAGKGEALDTMVREQLEPEKHILGNDIVAAAENEIDAAMEAAEVGHATVAKYDLQVSTAEIKEAADDMRLLGERITFWTREDIPRELLKYWYNRYSLFSLFDSGCYLDHEGWFSVTPEIVAAQIARRFSACTTVIDAFCGVGGNAIQFAMHCQHVIAIDIDPVRLQCARVNARVYGVEKRITFLLGDFLSLASSLKADAVFLSPPWGGPQYNKQPVFNLETMMPISIITENLGFFLPRNSDSDQLAKFAGDGGVCEMQQVTLDDRLLALSVYYGNLVNHAAEQSP